MTQKLVLIDGHAILHRAYHALPPLTNANGVQTNAVYGFMTMLLQILENQKPTHLVVAFDLPQATFRQQQYTAYQGRRPEMESNLSDQIPLVHQLLDVLEIPYFEVGGFEADDVIGTLSTQTPDEVIIVTGDRDMLQLVNDHVKVCVPVKGLSETKTYDRTKMFDEFGIKPEQWVDVKALKGDASDNYSGVRGIGPKTAEKLIQKYDTLENVYKNLKNIDKKTAIKLANGAEDAGLAQKLAKIVCDVPIHLDLEKSQVAKINWTNGVEFMKQKLGFKTIVARVEKQYVNKISDPVTQLPDKEDPQIKLL